MNKRKYKILLAEDDRSLGTLLKDYLELNSFDVSWVQNGKDALEQFSNHHFDLCLLDIMMPKQDGFTTAKKIKDANPNIPFVFLTAKNLQQDKIIGLKIGADDYITKPFNSEELLLRINNIINRSKKFNANDGNDSYIRLGKFTFNYNDRVLSTDSLSKKLTTKENDLLFLLVQNMNNVLMRKEALIKIWGSDNYFNARSMDVYISKLRSYLEPDKSINIITVHGKGYKLKIEPDNS